MAALARYVETRIADGNVTNALRVQIEGVSLGAGEYFDCDPATNTFSTYEGRANPLVNDDRVFYQKDPGGSVIGGLADESFYYIVNTSGLTMQVSETQGGQPVDVSGTEKGVFSKVLADYRQAVGEEILLAVKTNLQPELTDAEMRELIDLMGHWLYNKKLEKDGVT